MKTVPGLKEMNASSGSPRRMQLGVAFALALFSTASVMTTGCKDTKPNDAADAAIVQTSAAPVASSVDSALVATAAHPPEDTRDEPNEDAGQDAGKVRRRRAAVADAGVAVEAPPPPAPASTVEESAQRRPGKGATPMGDEAPYGGSGAASSTPILKKKPLGEEDPWVKGSPSTAPR